MKRLSGTMLGRRSTDPEDFKRFDGITDKLRVEIKTYTEGAEGASHQEQPEEANA
jgi:hypothetical protein